MADDEILEESLAALEAERAVLTARVLTLEQLYDALACHTHCACRREPGDCCAIGSVIGGWDKRYTEQWKELEAIQAERDALRQKYHEAMDIMSQWRNIDATAAVAERDTLRTALLAMQDHEETDGPCWCGWPLRIPVVNHGPTCLQVRAALGVATTQAGAATTPEPAPRFSGYSADDGGHLAPECDDPHTGSDPERRGEEPAP